MWRAFRERVLVVLWSTYDFCSFDVGFLMHAYVISMHCEFRGFCARGQYVKCIVLGVVEHLLRDFLLVFLLDFLVKKLAIRIIVYPLLP